MMQSGGKDGAWKLLMAAAACLWALPAFGAQSQSVQVTGGSISVSLPTTAPWTTIGASTSAMRWELRVHNFATDWPIYWNHLVNLGPVELLRGQYPNWAQASYVQAPAAGDRIYNNGPIAYGCCNTMPDVLVRVQRDVVNARYTLEVCNASGGGCLSGTAAIVAFGQPNWSNFVIDLQPYGKLAFLRWFSSVVPIGTSIPIAGATGDLGDWEFEGNLQDSSGHNLNMAATGAVTYTPTPIYPPACNAGAQQTFRAGYPGSLSGLGSEPADNGTSLSYVWQMVSGPSLLRWSSHTTPSPQISGMVFGTYVFQLTVADSSNQTSACTVKDGAVATDDNNIVITNNPAVDTLLGPMVRYGANPWPWFDNRHKQAADNENSVMNAYFPAWWDTSAPGTITVTTGSNHVVGAGTMFTTTFCQGPANPTQAQTGYPAMAVWHPLGAGTGRVLELVASCTDDTHLTLTMPYNDDGKTPPGSSLTYAADNQYASVWGWSQAPTPANYYDNVASYYALYYRSGIDDYLTAARTLADRFWESPAIDQGVHPWDTGYCARNMSALGLVLRALDGRPDMWAKPAGAAYGGLHTIWDDYMSYLNGYDVSHGIWDVREQAYHLAMISYCAMYDPNPTYQSECQTSLINSFPAIWTPTRFPDGSWPQMYYNTDPVTGYYECSWWSGTPNSVTLTNGSTTVSGVGTTWSAGMFPATIWFTNAPYVQPANNAAGDPVVYTATFVDATHVTLDRPYQGTSGTHGWQLSGWPGWGSQPFMTGILSSAFDLAAKALANVSPATAALAHSYNVDAANWVKNYGYWPLNKGLYYYAGGIACQAPIADSNATCTWGYVADQARSLDAEAFRGLDAAYAYGKDPSIAAFLQTIYNAMWGAPLTCPLGSTVCVPDGTYLDQMNDGQYGIATPPTLSGLDGGTPWKWFGFYFGYGAESSVSGFLDGGRQPGAPEVMYVGAHMASVPGAASMLVLTTAPSGLTSSTLCDTLPCAVTVDRSQGDPILSIQYLSATGLVLASSSAPVIGGQ